jgi:chaperonin cofactor prefoldin
VPENSTNNEELERLHQRRQELKKQTQRIEEKLEELQKELKKVTGRIVLPEPPPKRD